MILAQINLKLLCRQAKFPRILSHNGQNYLEGQGQWPSFSITAEKIPGCMFGANLVILAQIYDELPRGRAKFPRILSQSGQNDLESQGQWPIFFNTNRRYPMDDDACLVQTWGSQLKSANLWQVIAWTRYCLRMDRRRQRQYPFHLQGQEVKMRVTITVPQP